MEQAATKKSTLARIKDKMVPRTNSGESNMDCVDSDATVRACTVTEHEERQPKIAADRDCSRLPDLPLPTTSGRRVKWKNHFKSERKHTFKARNVGSQKSAEGVKRVENGLDNRIQSTKARTTPLEPAPLVTPGFLASDEDSANNAFVVGARSAGVLDRQAGYDVQLQLCLFFRKTGRCKHGSSCAFVHQVDPAIQQKKREAKERERDALVFFNAFRGETKSSCS